MSYEQWAACFAVYRTAMVMLGFASPAALDSYHDHIRQYATRYTTECWALLYQTDTRARRELSERIRRRAKSEYDMAAASTPAGQAVSHPMDPQRPWDHVFRLLPKEFSYWKKELEDPALMILAKVSSRSVITTEAQVASQRSQHITAVSSDSAVAGLGGRRGADAGAPSPRKKQKNNNIYDRQYNYDASGRNVTNRRGIKLCPGWQDGTCTSFPCATDASFAHQCSICLSERHGAKDCTPKGGGKKGGAGAGKGGKKGKGKGGKRPQW